MASLSEILPQAHILETKLDPSTVVSAVGSDSRVLSPGMLYFAVPGTQVDGHDFLPEVLKSPVAGVVVSRKDIFERTERAVLVRDVRWALAESAHAMAGKPTHRFSLLGVTGTNGKTTVSFLVREILRQAGKKTGLLGTVHYYIGDQAWESHLTTPGPVELNDWFRKMAEAGLDSAIMEVSSIALDQHRVSGARFEVAIFTNLTQDHLDYHGTMENYFQSKRLLFSDRFGAKAVLNIDDEAGERLAHEVRASGRPLLTYSLKNPAADLYLQNPRFDRSGTRAGLRVAGKEHAFHIPLLGKHNASNALAALGGVLHCGIALPLALQALEVCKGAPGRLERAHAEPAVFVDYAHTPDALENVIQILAELKKQAGGRLITVFGCGGDRDRGKRPLMGRIAAEGSDVVVVTSDNPRTENPDSIVDEILKGVPAGLKNCHRIVDRRAAIFKALELASPEDWVLVAGKGHETYQILGTQKHPFDDRQIIRDYYASA